MWIFFILVWFFPIIGIITFFIVVASCAVSCVEFFIKHPVLVFKVFFWCFLVLALLGGCLTVLEPVFGPGGTAIVAATALAIGCWQIGSRVRVKNKLAQEAKNDRRIARKLQKLHGGIFVRTRSIS
jgi:hypothetical protein